MLEESVDDGRVSVRNEVLCFDGRVAWVCVCFLVLGFGIWFGFGGGENAVR